MARDDEYVEIVLDDEDDLPPSGEGAAVLRFSADPLSVEGFPDVLVAHLGLVRAEAATVCRNAGGILLEDAGAAQAQAIAADLRALGEDCLVVPSSRLISLPRSLPIHSAALTAADLGPTDAAGGRDSAPWQDALAMVMGHVPHEEIQTHTRRRLSSLALGGIPGMAVGTSHKTTTKRASTRVLLQIVFDDPVRCYEINSREFDYSLLGAQLQPNSEANIQALARWFLHACPGLRVNFDHDRLLQTGRAELPLSTPKGLNQTARWLVNLEKLTAPR